ncbi:MAG TPA: ATP-binding protein [Rhodopila sp.]|jgi:serine/threonine-protein kinase RsbW|nr:ATP-binding protein [Rhodopila sp.]
MEATTDGFTIQIANDVAEIAKVTALLQAFGRVHALPEALVGHFVLALDELVANIVQHGLQPGTPATIRISVSLAPSTLAMEISDPGRAFDPLCETPPPDLVSPLEQRRVGGLGVHFVRTLMDEVRYRREHDRNVLTLSKARPTTSAQNPR